MAKIWLFQFRIARKNTRSSNIPGFVILRRIGGLPVGGSVFFQTAGWHALSAFFMVLNMNTTTARIEGYGSELKTLTTATHSGLQATVERLKLKTSGIRGDGSDDPILAKLVRKLFANIYI